MVLRIVWVPLPSGRMSRMPGSASTAIHASPSTRGYGVGDAVGLGDAAAEVAVALAIAADGTTELVGVATDDGPPPPPIRRAPATSNSAASGAMSKSERGMEMSLHGRRADRCRVVWMPSRMAVSDRSEISAGPSSMKA
jgi:hypothetical protein